MKYNTLLLFLLAFSWGKLQGQVVTTIPEFPTENQPITIKFEANLGNGALNNCKD